MSEDPDGFDEARRQDVYVRMVAMQAKHERDRRIATMTPLEIAESDLAATVELGRPYEAGALASHLVSSGWSSGRKDLIRPAVFSSAHSCSEINRGGQGRMSFRDRHRCWDYH